MEELLPKIRCPEDLRALSHSQLVQLAGEIREALCRLAATRTTHFASNLGVVELTLALHTTFDFRKDRLVWDTGHQVYAHKLVTGRYNRFFTIRTKGGLMGYPNPAESLFDLFITGHAGTSVSTLLGLKCGDDLLRAEEARHHVAVVGDGALSCGIVYEALNNAGGLKKRLIVVLNDNKMSICPRTGGLAEYLDRLRMTRSYAQFKRELSRFLHRLPLIGDTAERLVMQIKEAIKAGLLGGMFFEELGFHYLGPVDGHNIRQLQKYLAMSRDFDGPVLLHVVTEKGHGFQPAAADPVAFHTPAPLHQQNKAEVRFCKVSARSYTELMRDAILQQMRRNPKVVVIVAAMCQGNMLEPVREEFPDRFFDVGICESHAVAFAAGLAKAGLRPIVDIYSTFLQRSYDQIFQEVALQNLPVTMTMDRSGLVGPDGPTHHGCFDMAFLRHLPNLVIMAPGDEADVALMLDLALRLDSPTAIRYPKATAEQVPRTPAPLDYGKAEVLWWGTDGMIIACGALLPECVRAARRLREEGLSVGVINARFVKPLDTQTILRAVQECDFVLTVEEGCLPGGFGSAVLEAANEAGIDTQRLRRLGIPDRFIPHGERGELLADLELDSSGILRAARQMARHLPAARRHSSHRSASTPKSESPTF
ncbi:MAG: 1-deoxy-D-xylulose-5-phosphate synthase [Thermoguttaceae bacterium]|nr:1-deoxy-D-xylulose-5-phosphate synthase [Thermoguttaceae bacterium]MDW8038894.1 1-deoxy-D-xylulose-5-phosphate synthase [Thermoguttaceae bacterium]